MSYPTLAADLLQAALTQHNLAVQMQSQLPLTPQSFAAWLSSLPPPPPKQFVIGKCAIKKMATVGVLRSNGAYYLYNYCAEKRKLIPHSCSCQPKVTEAHLQPLYSEWSEEIAFKVLFVFNILSGKVEQYVYDFEYGQLKEVEKTGLVYNPALANQSGTISIIDNDEEYGPDEAVVIQKDAFGSLRKEVIQGNRSMYKEPTEVKTLMMVREAELQKNIDEPDTESDSEFDDSESDESDVDVKEREYNAFIKSLPPLILGEKHHFYAEHNSRKIVNAFNYQTETYEKFYYEEKTADFKRLKCTSLNNDITERHLFPMYTEMASDGVVVFHVRNTFTGLMEKYIFNGTGFDQVSYPELVYDYSKDSYSRALYVFTGRQSSTIIMRNEKDLIEKERFCPIQKKYVYMDPAPVRTFIVQRKEAEKKKKEEEKAKRRAERNEKRVIPSSPVKTPRRPETPEKIKARAPERSETPTQMTITRERVETEKTQNENIPFYPVRTRSPVQGPSIPFPIVKNMNSKTRAPERSETLTKKEKVKPTSTYPWALPAGKMTNSQISESIRALLSDPSPAANDFLSRMFKHMQINAEKLREEEKKNAENAPKYPTPPV